MAEVDTPSHPGKGRTVGKQKTGVGVDGEEGEEESGSKVAKQFSGKENSFWSESVGKEARSLRSHP